MKRAHTSTQSLRAAPRRVRLDQRHHVRPPLTWKEPRALWDPAPLQWLMFLLFWVLFWVYWAFLVSTVSYHPEAGIRLGTDQLVASTGRSDLVCSDIAPDSDFAYRAAPTDGTRHIPRLVFVDLGPFWEVRVSGQSLGAERFHEALRAILREDSPVQLILRTHPAAEYGDFVATVDEILRQTRMHRPGQIQLLILLSCTGPDSPCSQWERPPFDAAALMAQAEATALATNAPAPTNTPTAGNTK